MVEFKIYKDGRWRSVWRAVGGWTGARWVSRGGGGALREESASRVVSALRALAAGRPGAVRVGAPLPRRWPHTEPSRKKKRHRSHCIRYKRYEEMTNVKRTQRDASVQTDSQLRLHRHTNVLQPNNSNMDRQVAATKQDRQNKGTDTDFSTDGNVLTTRILLDNREQFKKPASPSKYVRRPASSTEQQMTDENIPRKRRLLSLNREQTKVLQTPAASPNTNKRRDSDNDKITKDFPTRHAQLYNVKKNLDKNLHVDSQTIKVRQRDTNSDSDKNINDNVRIKRVVLDNKTTAQLRNLIKSPTKTVRVRGSSSDSGKSTNDKVPKINLEHNNKKTNKLRAPIVSPKKPIRQIDSSTDSESADVPSKRTETKSQQLQKMTTSPSKKITARDLSADTESFDDNVFKKTKNAKQSQKSITSPNKRVSSNGRITKRQTHSISDVHKQTSKHVSSPMKRTHKEIDYNDSGESQDENEPLKKKTDDNYKRIISMKRKNSLEISSESESQENIRLRKRKESLKRQVFEALGRDLNNIQKKSAHNRRGMMDDGIANYLQKNSPIKPIKQTVQIDNTDSDSEKNREVIKRKKRIQMTTSDSDPSQVIFEGRRRQNNEPMEGYKELIIDEEDVTLLRTFIEKHCTYIDLYKFDCDDEYKQQIFYRINPVVRLERCVRIASMLRERETREFAGQLGLRSVTSSDNEVGGAIKRRSLRTARREQDGHSENSSTIKKTVQKEKDSTSEKTVRSDKDGGSKEGEKRVVKKTSRMAPMKAPKRSCVRPGREYTPLEDQSIVAWVSGGGDARARCVNGNRVWRQLQASYTAITGQVRSWHSLRNRYLRYILPALGALALPPRQAARLRAAAATGEIKSGKRPSRPSILRERPVQSASARRPRPPPGPPLGPPPGPPAAEEARRSPRVAALNRSAPSVAAAEPPAPPAGRQGPRRGRSPRYSEVTRRFANAHAHTDNSTDEFDKDGAQEQRTRSRRLYNPSGAV